MSMYSTRAETDSINGQVECYIGATLCKVKTFFPCKQYDTLQIQITNNHPIVVGVIGRGDEMQEQMDESSSNIITLTSNQEFIALMTDVDIWNNDPDNDTQYSQAAIIAKKNFDAGLWGIQRINMLLEAKKITQEEYVWIVGENRKD